MYAWMVSSRILQRNSTLRQRQVAVPEEIRPAVRVGHSVRRRDREHEQTVAEPVAERSGDGRAVKDVLDHHLHRQPVARRVRPEPDAMTRIMLQ